MAYNRELYQIQKSIIKAGDGAELDIIINKGLDPITGFPLGTEVVSTLYFVAVNYTREDIGNPSLANGLLKIIVSPLRSTGNLLDKFTEIVERKGVKLKLPDGKEFGVRHSQITRADGVTPIMARIFLGA